MVKQSVLSVAVVLSVVMAGCLDEQRHSQSSSNSKVTEALGASISTVLGDSMSASDHAVPAQDERGYQQSIENTQNPDEQISTSRQTAITRAVKKVSPAVVSITVTEMVQGGRRLEFSEYYNRFVPVPIEREVSSMGSGFIISSDGLVVTNQHVANQQAKRVVVSLPDGEQYEAEVLGEDELADLALLKIDSDRTFPAVEFGDSDSVLVGEWSLAVGNPFGLFESAKPSVTVGVVSAINRDFRPNPNEPRVYMDMIQTDAAINRGNSGVGGQ